MCRGPWSPHWPHLTVDCDGEKIIVMLSSRHPQKIKTQLRHWYKYIKIINKTKGLQHTCLFHNISRVEEAFFLTHLLMTF